MINRRDFNKLGAASFVSVLASCRSLLEVDEQISNDELNYYFDFLRPEDLCNLRFYFVNVKKRGKYLYPRDEQAKIYMLVRIPQQHISQAQIEDITKLNDEDVKKAYLSGFSYLTFQLKKGEERLKISPHEFLQWSKFNLVTLDDLNDTAEIKPSSLTGYPDRLLKNNKSSSLFFDAGGIHLPVTLFEVPYKLFLSPINPVLRGSRGDFHRGYQFVNQNNHLIHCFDGSEVDIYQPWKNELNYYISNASGDKIIPPRFKAVAHQVDTESKLLIPSDDDKRDIVEHSLLDFFGSGRDIKSKFFTIGALGVSTYLSYFNETAKKGSSFVGWKQDIKNGRDNFAEITRIGVDVRTNKKVLVSTIGERIIYEGKCLWIRRYYLKYIELKKEYDNDDFPYTSSESLEDGFYFKPAKLTLEGSIDYDQTSNDTLKTPFIPLIEGAKDLKNIYKTKYKKTDKHGQELEIEGHSFIIFKKQFDDGEAQKYLNAYSLLLQGQSKDVDKFIQSLLSENLQLRRLAYIPAIQNDDTAINKNTSLKTERFQYESKLNSSFESQQPVTLHLKYAKVVPPQLENFLDENTQENSVSKSSLIKPSHFCYSNNFLNRNGNDVLEDQLKNSFYEEIKNILNTYKEGKLLKFRNEEGRLIKITNSDKILSKLEALKDFRNIISIRYTDNKGNLKLYPLEEEYIKAKKLLKSSTQKAKDYYQSNKVFFRSISDAIENDFKKVNDFKIENIFSNNKEKNGLLINPDITIEALSTLDSGITFAENTKLFAVETRDRLESELKSIQSVRPRDILRGLKAEIFNGINLKEILQEVIPVDQSPLFEVAEKAEEGFRLLENYKDKYETLVNRIQEIPSEINSLKQELHKSIKNDLEKYIEKKLDLERRYWKIQLDKEVLIWKNKTSPYRKKIESLKDQYHNTIKDINDEISKKVDTSEIITVFKERKKEFDKLNDIQSALIFLNIVNDKKIDFLEELRVNIIQEMQLLEKEVVKDKASSINEEFQSLKKIRSSLETLLYNYSNRLKREIENEINSEINILNKQISPLISDQIKEINYLIENQVRLSQTIAYLQDLKKSYQVLISPEKIETILNKQSTIIIQLIENEVDQIKENLELERLNETIKEFEQKYYKEFAGKRESFEDLKADLQDRINELNREKFKKMISVLETRKREFEKEYREKFEQEIKELKNLFKLTNYKDIERTFLEKKSILLSSLKRFENKYKSKRQEIIEEIEQKQKELKRLENIVKDYKEFVINDLKSQLKSYQSQLNVPVRAGEARLKEIKEKVSALKKNLEKIQEPSSKTFNYIWKADSSSFREYKSSFISFIPNKNTELEVEVKTEHKYQLSINNSPKLLGAEHRSFNRLSSFSLGIFDILNIEFDDITFESGSKIDDSFDVNINSIKFGGALNFINAFEEFLSALKFLQQIKNKTIYVNYSFPLPQIAAGAFNFVNGKLKAGLELPLGGNEPISLTLGVNDPNDLFLVSYGIFGGRGCFEVTMNPRDGVTKVLLVIEFGGVVLINAGIAKGMGYLFAGIYYKKHYNTVGIEAYIVAGGCLNIANLISASVTFIMKLKGDGHYLVGNCSVQYTVKIGKFFKKTFTMSIEKRLKGAQRKHSGRVTSNKSNKRKENLLTESNNIPKQQIPTRDIELEYGDEEKSSIDLSSQDWNKYLNSYIKI